MPPSNPTAPGQISPLAAIIAGRAQRQSSPEVRHQAPAATSTKPVLQVVQSASQPIQPAPRSQEITHSGGETAQEIDQSLRKSVRNYRNAMVETAHFIYLLSERNEWAQLGFASVDDYRESLGLSESLWETHLLLGERLSGLTIDQMREITMSTARMITSINQKIWEEFAWIDEARVLRPKEFAALVSKRNQDLKVAGRVGIGAEPRASLTVAVPASQQQRLEGRIESLRRTRKLRSLSDAIELALAAAEREPVWSSQIQKLVQAVEELDRVWEMLPVESEQERDRRLMEGDGQSHSVTDAAILTQKITRRMLLVLSDLVHRGSEGEGGQEGDREADRDSAREADRGGIESDGKLSNQIERNSP